MTLDDIIKKVEQFDPNDTSERWITPQEFHEVLKMIGELAKQVKVLHDINVGDGK